jgi:hypothetical protein
LNIKQSTNIDINELIKRTVPSTSMMHSKEEEILQEVILSEYIREIIYLFSVVGLDNSSKLVPVHIKKIINTVRYHLDAIWTLPKSSDFLLLGSLNEDRSYPLSSETIIRIIRTLEIIGDVTHIGDGFWLPTPIRLIKFPNSEDIGLVGGWPTKLIVEKFQSVINEGLGRKININNLNLATVELAHLWQTYERWCSWTPPTSIINWTEQKLKQATAIGSKSSELFVDYEVYVSFKSKRFSQVTWAGSEDMETNDLQSGQNVLLCRTRMKPREYFLGVFQKGKLAKELVVKDEHISWLRMGLRLLHGALPSARWDGNWLNVYPPLPIALEQRLLFYSYKIPKSNFPSFYVHNKLKADVEAVLTHHGYIFKSGGIR